MTLDETAIDDICDSRGFFNFAQQTLPLLEDAVSTSKYPPSLIVTGATASVRGTALFATFAAGKWGKRALVQSLAREYGPKGVHVAHAVIDGVIDIPRTANYNVNGGVEGGKISPDSVRLSFGIVISMANLVYRLRKPIGAYILSIVPGLPGKSISDHLLRNGKSKCKHLRLFADTCRKTQGKEYYAD